jgi:hypothetical protein
MLLRGSSYFGRENQFVELRLRRQRFAVLRRLDSKFIRNVTIIVPEFDD